MALTIDYYLTNDQGCPEGEPEDRSSAKEVREGTLTEWYLMDTNRALL